MNYKTMLFIPGNNPGMLMSMDVLGADAYIVDLEDAVSLDNKDAARDMVKSYLNTFQKDRQYDVYVRINPPDTPFFNDDVEALKDAKINGLMLAKADPDNIVLLDKKLEGTDLRIFALIETARSLELAYEILSKVKRTEGVLLGAEDLTLDLGAKRTKASDEIKYARAKIVSAAKAAGIQAVDTPWTDTDDIPGLRQDTELAKAMGMTGKALISPRHVDDVNELFSPSKEDINYAKRVFKALEEAKKEGKGAFSLDGKMVDKPIILRATDVLKQAGEFTEELNGLIK